jgi:hypothetical protein
MDLLPDAQSESNSKRNKGPKATQNPLHYETMNISRPQISIKLILFLSLTLILGRIEA